MRAADRIGTTIKNFKILDSKRENGKTWYNIECLLCGNKKWMQSSSIANKNTISCGCNQIAKASQIEPKNDIDLSDRTFGDLKVLRKLSGKGSMAIWECECKCKNIHPVIQHSLIGGKTTSCGCLNSKNASTRIKKSIGAVENTTISLLESEKLYTTNTSGVKGVSYAKNVNKFHAYIGLNRKLINLGYYETIEEAIAARKDAEEEHFKPIIDKYRNK